MKHFKKIILSFIFALSHNASTMNPEDPTEIEVIDCNGNKFALLESAVQQLMPAFYDAAKNSWQDSQIIDFSCVDNIEVKQHLTKKTIKALTTVLTDPIKTMIPLENYQGLIIAISYLNSPAILLKRLGYIARKQHDYRALPCFLLEPSCVYSLKELINEDFFDHETCLRLIPIKNMTRRPDVAILKTFEASEALLDLSNYNIGSLEGLDDLVSQLSLNSKSVKHLFLNNNSLQSIDLDTLCTYFPNIYRIKLNDNPLKTIITTVFGNGVKFNCKNTLLTQLPALHNSTYLKLGGTSLSSRTRYLSRLNNVSRNMLLSSCLLSLYGFFLLQAWPTKKTPFISPLYNNYLQKITLQKLGSVIISSCIGGSIFGLFRSVPPHYPCYKVTNKNCSLYKKIYELMNDCTHISFDLITWPIWLPCKMYKSYSRPKEKNS